MCPPTRLRCNVGLTGILRVKVSSIHGCFSSRLGKNGVKMAGRLDQQEAKYRKYSPSLQLCEDACMQLESTAFPSILVLARALGCRHRVVRGPGDCIVDFSIFN